MLLGYALARLRELLQGQNATHWSDAELGAYLNRHVQSLVRQMTETNEGWHNAQFSLLATSARQVKSDAWEYVTPPWCMKIVRLRELMGTIDPATAIDGIPYSYITPHEKPGWLWNGLNTLQIRGFPTAKDMEILCAKRPANVTKGTLPTQVNLPVPPTSYMRLDTDSSADAVKWPHETLANSYYNAQVEITGSNARSGQINRCIGSTHFIDEAGTRYTVLQFEKAWTVQPASGDTYDMHFEMPEQHMQLVLLLAAHSAWGTRGHYDEQKAMSGLIAEEMRAFEAHITPRQIMQPQYLRYSAVPPLGQVASRTEDTQRPLWI